MSSKQNVGDEEMKGDQQPSLKEVVRGYLKSVPDEKLQEVVQKLEEAMVYNREDLLEKSRETLEKALGAAAGSSLYDALHKSGKISVVLYVVLSLPPLPLPPCLSLSVAVLLFASLLAGPAPWHLPSVHWPSVFRCSPLWCPVFVCVVALPCPAVSCLSLSVFLLLVPSACPAGLCGLLVLIDRYVSCC